MREKVAIVGSRWGHDEAALFSYLHDLSRDTIVISGGAMGADSQAENTWRAFGGEVWSLRPYEDKEQKHFGVESFIFRPGALPESKVLKWSLCWKNFRSAALFRDWMIAQECDRLMAFFRPGGSPGAMTTLVLVQDVGKPVNSHERELR